MQTTRIDIPEAGRSKLVQLLNALLADAVDLQTQLKQAHWNVKGPNFIALHELFDKFAGEAREHADLIAERVATLGGSPAGTARNAAAKSSLKEYPHGAAAGHDHVEAVAAALASFAKACRAAIESSNELRDAVTADILTEITRATDLSLWFAEAHLRAER